MSINKLQVAAYLPRSRANGPGLRSVLWVQGCPFHCPGCFNPDFLPFAAGRVVSAAELARVVRETEGFVGAELEAVVKDALFPAFMDGRRELETEDLVRAAGNMVPLAKSHHERIARLRELVVNGQARNASRRHR